MTEYYIQICFPTCSTGFPVLREVQQPMKTKYWWFFESRIH